jgi:electron transfer flavoprotein-quinone oxidoreductase
LNAQEGQVNVDNEKFEVVVVGAGPAGAAAAYTLAKAGVAVLVFERGNYPGAKNVMGGVLYRDPTERVIPGFWQEAPIERHLIEHQYWLTGKDSAVTLGYRSEKFGQPPYNSFTVLRAKFDRWFAQQAEDAGAMLITETLVTNLIQKDGKVVGVRTGRDEGEVYADCVILADGVNSLIARRAGLHPEIPPQNVALTVKEIIALPKETIQNRFNVGEDQGVTIEIFGEITKGMAGVGFLYTNKETLSIGVGALLSDYVKSKRKPYELIEDMKEHPRIAPLIDGGEVKEYMAHLIPEGGYRAIPRLVSNNVLLVGDSAQLVNSLFREGSNLAMVSGLLAAQAVIEARKTKDYSAANLMSYQRKMEDSFVLKDLKHFQKMPGLLETSPQLFEQYPDLVGDALMKFFTVDGVPKMKKIKEIFKDVKGQRSLINLGKDVYKIGRAIL